jgi:maleylacetoacetate isomerase
VILKLYSYWRSSASYRVRIALNLKGIAHEIVPVHLIKDGGQQRSAEYRALNPQGRVPLLVDGDFRLNQSLAILEYLEARHPQPALLPKDERERARIRAFCQTIAADIQPLQNLSTLQYLTRELGVDDARKDAWLRHWIESGLVALEESVHERPTTPFLFGEQPGWAECVLVPQIYAARRFHCDPARFPRLAAVAARCEALPAFVAAHPDRQPDAQT